MVFDRSGGSGSTIESYPSSSANDDYEARKRHTNTVMMEAELSIALQPSRDVETVALAEGGAMLVDLRSGHCWQLNRVGAEAWTLFQGGASVSHVTDALVSRYELARRTIETDVERIVQELTGQGLLVRTGPSRP